MIFGIQDSPIFYVSSMEDKVSNDSQLVLMLSSYGIEYGKCYCSCWMNVPFLCIINLGYPSRVQWNLRPSKASSCQLWHCSSYFLRIFLVIEIFFMNFLINFANLKERKHFYRQWKYFCNVIAKVLIANK